jgi:putative cell wall-binding protein
MKTTSINPTKVVFPDVIKGAMKWRKVANISEFIKCSSKDLNGSCQTLDTVATDVSDITDAQAHVQFSKQVIVSQIIHLYEYTQEEMEATWYQEEEYTRISKICIKTVHKMEQRRKRSLKKQEIESRGLEGHTTTGIVSKTENRRLAYEKILQEQEHQNCQGIYDDEAMAECYESVSSSCALWARKVALRDHIDAED